MEEEKKVEAHASEKPAPEAKAPEAKAKPKQILKIIKWSLLGILVFIIAVQISIADKYKAQVLVIPGEKKVGVNPTTEKLDFGDLSADTSATRIITMQAGGIDTFVMIWKFGKISELIKISENNFTMQKGDNKKIEFNVYMPPSAPEGELYTGNVWIFKVPKFW